MTRPLSRESGEDRHRPLRSVERVTVLRIVVLEGQGFINSPVREVTYHYEEDGTLIARRDLWEETQ